MAVFFYCQEDADADGGEIPPCKTCFPVLIWI